MSACAHWCHLHCKATGTNTDNRAAGVRRETLMAYRRESVWAHALGRAACRWVIKGDALMSLEALSARERKASAVDPS